ncbi:MAG: restriction endonuclease subunit S [Treponema sp.]|nr:restriction endonuclease subunit S [Treponema sp.]
MEEWKEYKLGDICLKIGSGATPSGGKEAYKGGGYNLIRSQNVLDFSFSSEGLVQINEEQARKLDNVTLQKNDVLLNITGDSVARACIIPNNLFPARVNQHVAILRANSDILDYHYLLYFLQVKKPQLLALASGGATRNALTKQMLENLPIALPPLPTQQKIAAILSSLDDKIELNNKINTNLEQQAGAIFKNWFVDFEPFGGKMPEGWKEKPLYDYADFINGTSFKEDEYDTKGVPIIKIAELKNGITDATQYFNGEKDPKYDVKNGDILFSWSGNPETSIDIFIWSLGDGILNQHTFNLKSNTDRKWFTYCLLKYFKPEFCHRASCKQTTGLGHVTANDLKQITFNSGEKEESNFEALITPIMNQIFNNKLENQKLVNIRDSLLPKLMNGEIEFIK